MRFTRVVFFAAAVLGAASAYGVGVYGGGGLASFGDLETRYDFFFPITDHEPLGVSFWVGGGVAVPVWRYPARVTPVLELATDAGFGMRSKRGEEDGLYENTEFSWKLVSVRENVLFGVEVGGIAKPFAGFGAGVAVAPWKSTYIPTGTEIDSHTEVKPTFGVPFGAQFRLGPTLSVIVRGEYLVVTGDLTVEDPDPDVHTSAPNVFLFTGMVGADL
jgi:opacity protein-like surface antigen